MIRFEDLAAEVGLSVSSLNRHFRAATAMSRVQYQKQIRLRRARVRLLANPGDVAGAGQAVGYASASQFNREYRRMFGVPRGRTRPGRRGPAWWRSSARAALVIVVLARGGCHGG